MAQSNAHTRASNKYNAKAYDRFSMMFKKGQKEQIAEYAKSKGLSLNAYVMGLIAADMGEKLTRPNKEQGE